MPEEHLKCNWNSNQREAFFKEVLTRLDQNGDLAGTVFPGDFVVSNGSSQINLSEGIFPGKLTLPHSHHGVDFSHATIDGQLQLRATIHKECNLTAAKCKGYGDFRGATITSLTCRETTFSEGASFANCSFRGFANFSSTLFLKPVTFEGADFSGAKSIGFRGAKFYESADFRVGGNPNMAATTFHSAVFFGKVGFEGRDFRSYLEFRNAVFHEAPRFQDSKISFESVFPKSKGFLDQTHVPGRLRCQKVKTQREYYEDAAQAYRTLRFAMKAQEAHDEEALFWMLEMRAKERSLGWHPTELLPWMFSKLYYWASRYGNSIGFPLAWWFAVFSLVACAIYCAPLLFEKTQSDGLLLKAAEMSFQQTVRPFAIWSEEGRDSLSRLFRQDFNTTPTMIFWFRMAATVQSIASLTLLALFGFALRRKFRMA